MKKIRACVCNLIFLKERQCEFYERIGAKLTYQYKQCFKEGYKYLTNNKISITKQIPQPLMLSAQIQPKLSSDMEKAYIPVVSTIYSKIHGSFNIIAFMICYCAYANLKYAR